MIAGFCALVQLFLADWKFVVHLMHILSSERIARAMGFSKEEFNLCYQFISGGSIMRTILYFFTVNRFAQNVFFFFLCVFLWYISANFAIM